MFTIQAAFTMSDGVGDAGMLTVAVSIHVKVELSERLIYTIIYNFIY